MLYYVTVGERTFEVDLGADDIRVDGTRVDADLASVEGTDVRTLLLDGASYRLISHQEARGRWRFLLGGRRYHGEAVDERTKVIREMTGGSTAAAGPRPVRAPMPGLVVRVEVGEGESIEEGQGVIIVEAMKMENELKAEAAGVVSRILVETGQAVDKGTVLVEFESTDDDAIEG